jgi:hypothetical protein
MLMRAINTEGELQPEHHLFPHHLRRGQTTASPPRE